MSEHAAVSLGKGAQSPPGVPSDRLLQDWKLARERALLYLDALAVPLAERAGLASAAVERALHSPEWATDGDALAMTLRELRQILVERTPPDPGAAAGVRIVAFDITLDGRRYGEWFDAIVEIK